MNEIDYKMRNQYVVDTTNNHAFSNFKGEIYENHVYFEINNYIQPDIKIIESKTNGKGKYGNFSYDRYGQIKYSADGIDLGEFDILGFDDHTIYYWEVTIMKNNLNSKIKRIRAKEELLQKLFPNKNIKIIIISPKYIDSLGEYEQLLVDEPDYGNFLSNRHYVYDNRKRKRVSLKELSKSSTPFHYFDEIINLSSEYYENISKMPKQYLIERLYDINDLSPTKMTCYNVEKKKYQTIRIKKNKIFKDGLKVKVGSKTHSEVKYLLKINC